jgi:hypothetical protein
LTGVDSTRFPQVTVYADAYGGNGLPLTGLTGANFGLREDNRSVAAEKVTAQVESTQPLWLVLVLDRSVSAADWTQLRAAANTLLDGLRGQDQAALYTFGATVELVQPTTGDANALKAALAAVTAVPPGSAGDNALHQAMVDASNLAATLPAGRRAVVMLTGGTDNTGLLPPAQVASMLSQQAAPVHLLGFGAAAPATLAGLAQLTAGNSATVAAAADLGGPLQTLLRLLQQGYRLDYSSALKADDAEHTLRVELAGQGIEAESSASFVARSGPVTVTLPNVTEGATVRGMLDLTAQTQAPAPVVSLEYRLNGDVLAKVKDPSSSVIFDSTTVEPGRYTVEVTAVDAAGNTGVAEAGFVVEAPILVTALLTTPGADGEIFVGDEVTVEADVDAAAGRPRVEVYVDRALVGAADRLPYTVRFDSSQLRPGRHEIIVVASDGEGHEARTQLALPLSVLPEPTLVPTAPPAAISVARVRSLDVNWGLWAGYVGAGLVLLILLALLLSLARRWRRALSQHSLTPMRLSLTNLGNIATGYLLRGEDPAGVLSFRFSLNGVALGLPPVARFESAPLAVPAAASGSLPQPMAGVPGSTAVPGGPAAPAPAGGSGIPKNMDEMVDQLNEVSMVGRLIADILMSITYFLPSGLARPVRTVVMQIRRGQYLARRVQYVRKQVSRLNQTEMGSTLVKGAGEAAAEAGRVATAEGTRTTLAEAGRSAGAAVATAGKRAVGKLYELKPGSNGAVVGGNGAMAGTAVTGMAAGAAGAAGRQWAFVPPLNPGETVVVDVLVGLRQQPRKTEHYPFRLVSRALGEEQAQPVVEEGSIRIQGIGFWRRFLWMIVFGALVVVAAAVIWLLVV